LEKILIDQHFDLASLKLLLLQTPALKILSHYPRYFFLIKLHFVLPESFATLDLVIEPGFNLLFIKQLFKFIYLYLLKNIKLKILL